MFAETLARNLVEDWQARREQLARSPGPIEQRAEVQIKVLDYLIRRYRDLPEGARPARTSRRRGVLVDERAVVVFDHAWQGRVGGAKSAGQASRRVTSILHRMRSPVADDRASEDQPRRMPHRRSLASYFGWSIRDLLKLKTTLPHLWGIVRWVIRGKRNALPAIEEALQIAPLLPENAVVYLYERLAQSPYNEVEAAELLARCKNRSVINYAVLAWRERLAAGRVGATARRLEDFFRRPDVRKQAAQRVREELAHRSATVRLRAIALISTIGTLEDIGLFSDLLALPPQADEHPRERDALAAAMRRLAGAK